MGRRERADDGRADGQEAAGAGGPGRREVVRLAATAGALALLAACGTPGTASVRTAAPARAAAQPPAPQPPAGPEAGEQVTARQLPGLGPATLAAVPAGAGQVVLVVGEAAGSPISSVTLHERGPEGWRAGPTWPAHNGARGWTPDHREGDLRTPVGVFGLSDAGGLLPDPGTRLPYHRSDRFTAAGTGVEGEPLTGSFDHVLAIDYNRVPGTSPLERTRPLGAAKGGGIWLHVDHAGPTRGCVSIAEEHVRELLLALDPALHPVVVMGDAASLAR
ncbi:hypothetical protein NUM3379_15040 [Kineococcus sp. NUM-3379]